MALQLPLRRENRPRNLRQITRLGKRPQTPIHTARMAAIRLEAIGISYSNPAKDEPDDGRPRRGAYGDRQNVSIL